MAAAGAMKAWRTHAYGEPATALKLDTVAVPEPGDGEVRVRAQGIPLNLNDLVVRFPIDDQHTEYGKLW